MPAMVNKTQCERREYAIFDTALNAFNVFYSVHFQCLVIGASKKPYDNFLKCC